MTAPLSWQTIQYVLQRLAGIRTANGFYSDVGAYVQYSDRTQVSEDAPYVLVIAQDFEPGDNGNTRSSAAEDMGMLIEYGLPRTENLQDVEYLLHCVRADVRRALAKLHRNTAPPGLNSITIAGSVIGDSPDGADLLVVQVSARAALTDVFTPAS